jgi:hypothetical protein
MGGQQLALLPNGVAQPEGRVAVPPLVPADGCRDEQIFTNGTRDPQKTNNLYFMANAATLPGAAGALAPSFSSQLMLTAGQLTIRRIGACVDYENASGESVAAQRWSVAGIMGVMFALDTRVDYLDLQVSGSAPIRVTPSATNEIVLRVSSDPLMEMQMPNDILVTGDAIEHFHTFYAALNPVPSAEVRILPHLVRYVNASPGDLCPPIFDQH